ncbi:MAG: hypothetical protein C4303_01435, partial [candidate division GAL15 bacterium]
RCRVGCFGWQQRESKWPQARWWRPWRPGSCKPTWSRPATRSGPRRRRSTGLGRRCAPAWKRCAGPPARCRQPWRRC